MWDAFGEAVAPRDVEDPRWPPPPTWVPRPPQQKVIASKWDTALKATRAIARVSKPLVIGDNSRTRKPPSWRSFKEVSVSGIDATMDRRSPLLRRVLWACVLVVCTSLMLAQCMDRMFRYLEEPVNVNVRITHNESLEFPAVTVCNKNSFNRTAALNRLVQHQLLPPSATETEVKIEMLVGLDGMTASDVWKQMSHNRSILIPECWFGRGVKCDQTGVWSDVQTVIGPCFTYKLNDNQVRGVGTFQNLFLRLHETTPVAPKGELGLRVLLHEPHDSPVLTARTHSMSAELGWSREVKLELRKFQTINTEKTPCLDDPTYSEAQCHANCFQRAMNGISKCRMPYMSSDGNGSECATPAEYDEAIDAIGSMLMMGEWSVKDCDCEHECHQTTFQAYPENMAYVPHQTRLRIFFEELVFEQITEEMAYPMISLLCDIGGTLGLLMGASVLTVCELLEVAWSKVLLRCCRLEERRPPSLKPEMRQALAKLRLPPTITKISPQLQMHAFRDLNNQQSPRSTLPPQHAFASFA